MRASFIFRWIRGRLSPRSWAVIGVGCVAAAGLTVAMALTTHGSFYGPESAVDRTNSCLRFTCAATRIVFEHSGSPPRAIDELLERSYELGYRPLSKDPIKDGWGAPIRLAVIDERTAQVEIRSAGPNRTFDDVDDVVRRFDARNREWNDR